jgi:hypothetical protein
MDLPSDYYAGLQSYIGVAISSSDVKNFLELKFDKP